MAKIFDFFKRKPIVLTGETTEEWIKMCKKKFNINDYKGKYVMHCKTEEEAKDFCNYLHSVGKKWSDFKEYIGHTSWGVYARETCYNFNSGCFGRIAFYLAQNYTILEWEDFMLKEPKECTAWGNYQTFTEKDLKNNDIITYRNGKRGIVFVELEAIVNEDLNGYIPLNSITSNLTNVCCFDWDIVKVQRANNIHCFMKSRWDTMSIVWERQETVEMTLAEVCKALGKNVKIVKE